MPRLSPWLLTTVLLATRGVSCAYDWQWSWLNQTLNGRLQQGVPFSRPCFVNGTDSKCAEIQHRYEDHLFRSENFGAYEIPQWETCQATGDDCLLDYENTYNSSAFNPPRVCKQGSVPSYYVEVQGPEDVRAAYSFVEATRVPLVIKNSGHDYSGRSSGPGSLALWTKKLDKMTFNPSFQPERCASIPTSAVTIGAGQNFRAIYNFARAHNVTFLGGADPSVGASGGWVMGGGHSALSPAYGLGIDRVLEFKIVTPDGAYRTVNRCQNSDLFFALRGGGGSTFGVVLESTFYASPQTTVEVVLGVYDNTRENSVALIKELAKGATQFASEGWGGYINPPRSNAIWVNPIINGAAAAQKSAEHVTKAFQSVGGMTVFYTMDSYTTFFDTFIEHATDPVGRPQVIGSRLISAEKMADEDLIDKMANAMLDTDFSQILSVGPYAFKGYDDNTSLNPAWRNGVWHAVMSYHWNYDDSVAERIQKHQKLTEIWAPVRDATPGAAVYSNEADVFEPDHQNAFWGKNYDRLLSIKRKYDPKGLLDCWRCVGWKGKNDSRYKCYLNF